MRPRQTNREPSFPFNGNQTKRLGRFSLETKRNFVQGFLVGRVSINIGVKRKYQSSEIKKSFKGQISEIQMY
jgi:hypothetical protein